VNGLAVCAGAGGLELGLHLALGVAYRCVGYVERDAYAAAVLVARMEDQALDRAPVWDDLATFDGRPWHGRVDLLSAGFPCQPSSSAGARKGTDDERWLWPDIARVIEAVEPRLVFVENVPGLLTVNRGDAFAEVVETLAALGFDAEWDCFSATEVGASHLRQRLFVLAHARRGGTAAINGHPPRDATGSSAHVGDSSCVLADAASGRRRGSDWLHVGLEPGPLASLALNGGGRHVADADGRGQRVDGAQAVGGDDGSDDPDGSVTNVGDADGWDEQRDRSGRADPRLSAGGPGGAVGDPHEPRREGSRQAEGSWAWQRPFPPGPGDQAAWGAILADRPTLEPAVRGVADGLAYRVDRLRAVGNGVVPMAAAVAWLALSARAGLEMSTTETIPPSAPPGDAIGVEPEPR
jgi:DNA (cytosine-5)-methyltransferase 1